MGKQRKIRKLRFTISFKFGAFITAVLIFTAVVIGLFVVEQQKVTLQDNLKKNMNSYLSTYQSVVRRIIQRAIIDTKDEKKRNGEKRGALKRLRDYTISLKAIPNFHGADFVENARGGRVHATARKEKNKTGAAVFNKVIDKKFLKKYKRVDFYIQDLVLPNESYFIKVRGASQKKDESAISVVNDLYESYRPIYVNYFKKINRYDNSLEKAFFLFKNMKKKNFLFKGKQSQARLNNLQFINELEKIYKWVYNEKFKNDRLVKVKLSRYGKSLPKRKKFKVSMYNLRFLARYIKYLRKYKEPTITLRKGKMKAQYYVENPARLFNKKFIVRSISILENFYRNKLTIKQKNLLKKVKAGKLFKTKLSNQDRFELQVAMTYRKIAAQFIDIVTGVKDEKRRKLFNELTSRSFIRPFQSGGDALFVELKLFDSYFKKYLDSGRFPLPKYHKYLRLAKEYYPQKSIEQQQEFFRHIFRMVILPYRFGTVRIVLSGRDIKHGVDSVINKTIDISAFLVFRLIFFAFVVSGFMVKNIRNLAKGADQVGKGDYDTHIEIGTSDELGQLADRFNLMVSEIKESQFQMIEKARMEEDLQTAHRIQESLLPSKFPEVDGFEFAGYYKAQTEAGGDYYDAIPPEMTGGDYFGLASADVSGHGVGAGLVMTMVRSVLRAQSIENEDPGRVLSLANPQIHSDTLPAMFATAVYFTVNFKSYTMQYASAGHDPAILYNVETKELRLLPAQGIPLGMSGKDTFNSIMETKKDKIKKNDILILYTDGITEAMNGEKEEYEEDRFCKAIKRFGHLPLNELLEALVNDVKEFTNNLPQEDDISLLAMKVVK